MTISKSAFGDSEMFVPVGDGVSSQDEDDDLQSQRPDSESEPSEVDSGMGSDDYDVFDLGEAGYEHCQIGNQNCLLPLELYDLPDLSSILSMDSFNNCLTEEERFSLSAFLPDMDQETYSVTMRELLSGSNFHFGNPVKELFDRLKGGLCEPKVDLHRRCLNFFQRTEHYHRLQKYQNSMVESLVRMRNMWENYAGYGIEERIRLLNILRSQRPINRNKNHFQESDTDSDKEICLKKKNRHHSQALRGLGTKKRPLVSSDAISRKEATGFDSRRERNRMNYADEDDHAQAPFVGTPVRKRSKPLLKLGKMEKHKRAAPQPVYQESLESLLPFEPWDSQRKTKIKNSLPKSKSRKPLLPSVEEQFKEEPASESSGQGEEDAFTTPLKKKKVKLSVSGFLNNGEQNSFRSSGGRKIKKKVKNESSASPFRDDHDDDDHRYGDKLGKKKNKMLQEEDVQPVKQEELEVVKLDRCERSTDAWAVEDSVLNESFGSGLDFNGKANLTLAGCNSTAKKRKVKPISAAAAATDDLAALPLEDEPGTTSKMKKKLKKKPVSQEEEAEQEPSPSKRPFTLITPSFHAGFSFSVVHLLSAVRRAMVGGDDELDPRSPPPSLTVQEIVARVRTNPGDPCILETHEPLQDLVRGVLKTLASKTAPLGAKGWKPLAAYEKTTKTWSWVGGSGVPGTASEEETSPEAWGVPHKTLAKLVDSFANWLKSGQETLKQIGSLPAPPALPPPVANEKERFKDLRAQKSLVTINPSSDEARAYFRREELLRYSVPDRAFAYTAADGRKSTVAPLRRGGGKPTSKARDHFMLKQDRPPHVTILCLVRDAAARLPGSIGTRADVSTLMKDSQFLVEEVPDAKINSVVSGALDRLHYEQDPCVQYDGERKLWVYLHRDREEEDFEDDGTASKKKWKRPRKERVVEEEGEEEDDEEGVAALIDSMERGGGAGQGHPMGWEVLGAAPTAATTTTASEERRMVCRENSANEDFDDDGFARERAAGLVTTTLLF
ncbi:nuclear factor kappa-B-binding-like protein [Wolffia australiana]